MAESNGFSGDVLSNDNRVSKKRDLWSFKSITAFSRICSGKYRWLRPVMELKSMSFVYAIKSLMEERIYVGNTQNIEIRLKYHNLGYVKSTAKYRPWILIALKEVKNKNEARWIERELKKSRGKRIKWIEKNRIKQ